MSFKKLPVKKLCVTQIIEEEKHVKKNLKTPNFFVFYLLSKIEATVSFLSVLTMDEEIEGHCELESLAATVTRIVSPKDLH